MAKYYVFHYSETPSKKSGEVYVNLDLIPDNDQERVLSVSIKKADWLQYDDVKNLSPEALKHCWLEVFSYWNSQYKFRSINGVRKVGNR